MLVWLLYPRSKYDNSRVAYFHPVWCSHRKHSSRPAIHTPDNHFTTHPITLVSTSGMVPVHRRSVLTCEVRPQPFGRPSTATHPILAANTRPAVLRSPAAAETLCFEYGHSLNKGLFRSLCKQAVARRTRTNTAAKGTHSQEENNGQLDRTLFKTTAIIPAVDAMRE